MNIEIPEAWLIHKSWSGDTSAYVILFTKTYGLIKCLYKGGRTPLKQALLQSFQPLWLSFTNRNDFNYINKLELTGLPYQLTGGSLFAALYINELIFHLLKINDPHPELHVIYLDVLQHLSHPLNRKEIEIQLRRFERALLSTCGYHLSFSEETQTYKPIMSEAFYQFIPGDGFLNSAQGIPGAHLIAIDQDRLEDENVLYSAKKIMRAALEHVLDGKEIMARRLYSRIVGPGPNVYMKRRGK